MKKVVFFISYIFINNSFGISFNLNDYLESAKKELDNQFQAVLSKYKNEISQDKNVYSFNYSANLSQNEVDAIAKRKASADVSLKNILGNNRRLNIAFCGSGGGYRAMIYTLGMLQAAQKTGLLNAALYMSALSGSTWALNAWLLSGKSLNEISTIISENISKNAIVNNLGTPIPENLASFADNEQLIKNFVAKSIFEQPLTSVDVWGAIIINNLLGGQNYLISSEQNLNNIYPLNTMVNPKGDFNYDWLEVTPFDVRNLNNNLNVPIQAFGRRFENNKSIDFAPQLPASFYLGTFGSAFTVSLEEYERMSKLIDKINQNIKSKLQDIKSKIDVNSIANKVIPSLPRFSPTSLKTKRDDLVSKLVNYINNTLDDKINRFELIKHQDFDSLPTNVKGFRFLPAKVSNPQNNKLLTLVDAGININLPIKPLLKPERNVDVILVFDASETVTDAPELNKAIEDYNLNYDNIAKINESLTIYQDSKKNLPTIIYLPMIKGSYNLQLLKNHGFNLEDIDLVNNTNFEKEVKGGFCSTFNFKYSQEQFKALNYLAQFNLISNFDEIKNVLMQ